MRTFISHSGLDKAWFRCMAVALARAGVTIWDYQADDRTTIAGSLDVELDQVRSSDVFVVLVSNHSLVNPHVTREVVAATAAGFAARRRFFVVTLPATPPRPTWPRPFMAAAAIVANAASSFEGIETITAEVLGTVGCRYVPGTPDPPRLPLLARTLQELGSAAPAIVGDLATRPQSQFNRLVHQLELAASAYAAERDDDAEAALDLARTQLRALASSFRPYYLVIAQVVCALHRDRLDSARVLLESLADHPLRDESWHAACGRLAQRNNDLASALASWRAAVDLCQKGHKSDSEALANLCQLELELGLAVERVPSVGYANARERVWLCTLAALVYLRRDDAVAAVAVLDELSVCELDPPSISVLATALEAAGDVDGAVQRLQHFLVVRGDMRGERAALLRQLARLHISRGALCTAASTLRAILDAPAVLKNEAMMAGTELARLGRAIGDEGLTRWASTFVRRHPPGDPADYYCFGFAAHLLGETQLAAAMFELSAGYGRWYTEVLSLDAAAVASVVPRCRWPCSGGRDCAAVPRVR